MLFLHGRATRIIVAILGSNDCHIILLADVGFVILVLVFWISAFGFWSFYCGFWILDFGFGWVLSPVLKQGSPSGFWILDFRFCTRFQILHNKTHKTKKRSTKTSTSGFRNVSLNFSEIGYRLKQNAVSEIW